MIQQYIIFVVPLILSLAITPLVIGYAKRVGAMDEPNERKVHKYPIPRLGGVAIYISFFLSLVAGLYFDPSLHTMATLSPHNGVMLVISLTIVLLLGIWDDLRPLTPGRKLIGQVIAATIVYFAGFKISAISQPFGFTLLNLGIFDYPITLLWIVGVTNAFNLIDGLDGLASGVAFIVAITMFAIASLKGDVTTAMLALLLAGSILGFLRYNFHGARIFLGDSGSLFLGFALSILSMQSSTKGATAFSIIVPMLALGLPIMDTLLSMTRRLLRSMIPDDRQSSSFVRKLSTIFSPDRGHIHHQLISRGFSHRKVVLVLYGISCAFGIGAFAVTISSNFSASLILTIIGIATAIGIGQLRYKEMAVLRNGVLLPLYEWPLMNSRIFQSFLDLGFMMLAYTAAFFLTAQSGVSFGFESQFFRSLMVVTVIQLVVFYFTGLYRATFRQIGLADLLKILKTVTLSVTLTWFVLAFLPRTWSSVSTSLMILNFYLLLSLVVGTRISFHILSFLFRQEKRNGNGGKRVLIYGADAQGGLMMQQILHDDHSGYVPIGFLDDDPQLEGKRFNGYTIYGSHWTLPRLARTMKIDEIFFSGDDLQKEVMRRLGKFSREHGITLRVFRAQFHEVSEASAHADPLTHPLWADVKESFSTQSLSKA